MVFSLSIVAGISDIPQQNLELQPEAQTTLFAPGRTQRVLLKACLSLSLSTDQ